MIETVYVVALLTVKQKNEQLNRDVGNVEQTPHKVTNTWTTIVKQGRLAGNKWWYKRVLPNMITSTARAKTLCTCSCELREAWKNMARDEITCVLPRQNKKIKYLYYCLLIYTCTYIQLRKNWTKGKAQLLRQHHLFELNFYILINVLNQKNNFTSSNDPRVTGLANECPRMDG